MGIYELILADGNPSCFAIVLSHCVHEMIVLNRKAKGTNDESKKVEDKIKHSYDNEDPTNRAIEE
jgi:hypothetical protein